MFGKGGMVDLGMVRTKILGDWYAGKLNNLFLWLFKKINISFLLNLNSKLSMSEEIYEVLKEVLPEL